MFYEQFKKPCKENNTSITAVLKKLRIGTANGTIICKTAIIRLGRTTKNQRHISLK